jgi:pimeloyl-ACP methyl ester carboxylesterase
MTAERETDQKQNRRTTSMDGTEIVVRVRGEGPPIVLLPAGPGDSELSWRHVVPFVSEQCTCYLLETRGRGESADHPDHSPDRLVEDVVAVARSIGEPVGLVGWGSALAVRVAARNGGDVFAVALYELGAGEVMSEESGRRMGEVFARVGELVAKGRMVDAARAFVDGSDVIYSEEDLATGAPQEFWEAAANRLPLFLQESKQAAGSGQPGATSPAELGKITMPVLLLHGDRSSRWFSDSVQHVAEHVPDARLRQIADAAHFGPYTQPRAVADEIIRFFVEIHASGRSSGETGRQSS